MAPEPKVTTRNFLKTKVQLFQSDTIVNGVPNRTNSALSHDLTPYQIKVNTKPKLSLFRMILGVLSVDITGHKRTQKQGVGLRKGYDLQRFRQMSAYTILSSVFPTFHFNKNIATSSPLNTWLRRPGGHHGQALSFKNSASKTSLKDPGGSCHAPISKNRLG